MMKKVYSSIIIIIVILMICSSVIATTGDLYNKYKGGDFSAYEGTMEELAVALEEERNYLATEGLLR